MFRNRIVSWRELSLWTLVYFTALALAAIGLIFIPPPAHGSQAHKSTGDQKFVVTKRDYWTSRRSYTAPDGVGTGVHIETYLISVSPDYIFWPGAPDGINRIAITKVTGCYSRISGNGSLFQGANVNPYFDDDDMVVNPGVIEIDDDGTDYNCQSHTIDPSNRKWFRMDQAPGWSSYGKVRKALSNDDDFRFKWGDSFTKFFHPGDDPEVNDWHFCDCHYG